MPELPEVETVARQLNAVLARRRIDRLQLHDPKLQLDAGKLTKCRIARVRRYGKRVVLELIPIRKRHVALWLCIHLRMTGRLIWAADDGLPGRYRQKPRATLKLDEGTLFFLDTRRFGTITLHDKLAEVLPAGQEPLSANFTWRQLHLMMQSRRAPLKVWLLQQEQLVGIGNIYASEICFRARLSPLLPANQITEAECRRLFSAIRRILQAAIDNCGTTFSDFQDSQGEIGGYARYLKVYKRENLPCPRCRAPIARIVQAQRSSFYCPCCQADADRTSQPLQRNC